MNDALLSGATDYAAAGPPAFLTLWDRAELFDPARGALPAWLARIARNRAIDRLRAATRHDRAASFSSLYAEGEDGSMDEWLMGSGAPIGLAEPEPVPEIALVDSETRATIEDALRALDPLERQVIVLRPGEAGARQEIVLTQDDVRQVQLCKGAIASGIAMLQHVAGFPDDKIDELMLAGGFGNYLSIPSAVRIGLIPPLPSDRIRYVGNAASLGAQICLLSEPERARAADLAARIQHVSLAAHPDFETIFVDAMNFPRP